jgi:hypothetical protein
MAHHVEALCPRGRCQQTRDRIENIFRYMTEVETLRRRLVALAQACLAKLVRGFDDVQLMLAFAVSNNDLMKVRSLGVLAGSPAPLKCRDAADR